MAAPWARSRLPCWAWAWRESSIGKAGGTASLERCALDSPMTESNAIIEIRGITKRFPGVVALDDVSFDIAKGELHAIVGENGAGKSTLIMLLTGVIHRSGGEILWEGKHVALASPQEAIDHGIDAVHQEMLLCRHLTVAANMFLGEEKTRYGLMRKKDMTREAQRVFDDIGFHLPAGAVLGTLTIGQQQLVATARASCRRCSARTIRSTW